MALFLAGLYNIFWGALVVLFPNFFFDLFQMTRPNYPQIWQCVGMIVGVYGIGYLIASTAPNRHWPIVLVGFLGKIFGPIGFVYSIIAGDFPVQFGVLIIFNDLIWLYPFYSLLKKARNNFLKEQKFLLDNRINLTKEFSIDSNTSLYDYCLNKKVLLIFLRHKGCTFCRKTLDELYQNKNELIAKNISPVIIHMSESNNTMFPTLAEYKVSDLPAIADPEKKLYRAFNLKTGNILELFGPKVFLEGIKVFIKGKYGIGALDGDGFQLGGSVLLDNLNIVKIYQTKNAADSVDFCLIN
jgi:hypothetical protein